jgi:hypothetical protein
MERSVVRLAWLITLTVSAALLLPKMVQEGLFMDGMLYSCTGLWHVLVPEVQ